MRDAVFYNPTLFQGWPGVPRAQAGSLTIDYSDAGSGMPVIFIPGITEYKEAFAFQSRGLEDSYRIISYDLRRGLKRASDYSLDLLVSDLEKFMESLKLNSAVICGHSFGGLIAMRFAQLHPEATNALILVSSFPSATEIPTRRLQNWLSSVGHPLHTSLGASLKVHLSRWLGARTMGTVAMQDEYAAIRAIARQAAKVSSTTVHQRMGIVHNADLRPALQEIVNPTLIIAGAKDKPFFLASAEMLYHSIPDATLEVIEGGGHFCFLTKHDRFNATVDDFLTERLAQIA